jgi:hypothetical protein
MSEPNQRPAAPARSAATSSAFSTGAWLLGLLVLGGVVVYFAERESGPTPERAAPAAEKPAGPPSVEEQLCRRYQELNNAHDPKARELLGPAPVVPSDAVPPDEADRLTAEFFLRDNPQVVEVRPETAERSGPAARFCLVLGGSVSTPRLSVSRPPKVDVENRMMVDPEVIVRVENDKIYAVRARKPHDPNEREPSEEEKRLYRAQVERQQRKQIERLLGRSGGADE